MESLCSNFGAIATRGRKHARSLSLLAARTGSMRTTHTSAQLAEPTALTVVARN